MWAIVAPIIIETHWTYDDLENTPPDWLNECVAAIDEVKRYRQDREIAAQRDAKRKARWAARM